MPYIGITEDPWKQVQRTQAKTPWDCLEAIKAATLYLL